jgi:hypothetical protein
MAIQLERPTGIRVGFVTVADEPKERSPLARFEAGMAMVARGFVLGIGLGIVLIVGGRAPLAEVTALGIVAIGAALLSWDQ